MQKLTNILNKIKYFWKDYIVYPFYDFILNHFYWLPYDMEGQFFRHNDGGITIKWYGRYNKNESTILNKKLIKKFKYIPHGSVFICRYIWGVDGEHPKNIKDILVEITPYELREFEKTHKVETGYRYGIEEYELFLRNLKSFDKFRKSHN